MERSGKRSLAEPSCDHVFLFVHRQFEAANRQGVGGGGYRQIDMITAIQFSELLRSSPPI